MDHGFHLASRCHSSAVGAGVLARRRAASGTTARCRRVSGKIVHRGKASDQATHPPSIFEPCSSRQERENKPSKRLSNLHALPLASMSSKISNDGVKTRASGLSFAFERLVRGAGVGLGACAGVIVAANCLASVSLTMMAAGAVYAVCAAVGAFVGLRLTTFAQHYTCMLVRTARSYLSPCVSALAHGAVRLKNVGQHHAGLVAAAGGSGIATGVALGLAGLGTAPAVAVAVGCLVGAVVAGAIVGKKYLGWPWYRVIIALLVVVLIAGFLVWKIYFS